MESDNGSGRRTGESLHRDFSPNSIGDSAWRITTGISGGSPPSGTSAGIDTSSTSVASSPSRRAALILSAVIIRRGGRVVAAVLLAGGWESLAGRWRVAGAPLAGRTRIDGGSPHSRSITTDG